MNSTEKNNIASILRKSGYWNNDREKLKGYLAVNSTNLSNLYEAAVLLMYEYKIPGREWLICHAVREICNTLPRILSRDGGIYDYKNEVKKVKIEFDKCNFRQEKLSIFEQENGPASKIDIEEKKIEVPYKLIMSLEEFLSGHSEASERNNKMAEILFEHYAPENVMFKDTLMPCIDHYKRTRAWFTGKSHIPEIEQNIDETELERNFRVFESTLISLMGKFFENLEDIDELLDKTNKRRN